MKRKLIITEWKIIKITIKNRDRRWIEIPEGNYVIGSCGSTLFTKETWNISILRLQKKHLAIKLFMKTICI